jgi:RimJ/RimL family protein N-acetyltransferase
VNYNYPPEKILLKGRYVELVPLSIEYLQPLIEAASDGELCNLWFTLVPTPEKFRDTIVNILEEEKIGKSLGFVVIQKNTNRVVGFTRYMNIEKNVRRLEIGSTWYSQSVQRTGINTECKLLLLGHAFENLKCIAVEFRTHRLNEKSRRAIERLGAIQDGILRNHLIMPDGTLRDTVVYSILDREWPTIKKHLEFKLK